MSAETITNALPIIISAFTFCITTLATGFGAVWLYWTKVHIPNREKSQAISSTFNREQAHSSQVAYQVGESKRDAAFLETYGNMANHLITSNNGHMTGLTNAVIVGFKEITLVILDGFRDLTLSILGGFKDITIALTQQSAAINQMNYFLQERTGKPLAGGDSNILDAAILKTEAVKRSDDIVMAVEQHIKDVATANDTLTTAHEAQTTPPDAPKESPSGLPVEVLLSLRPKEGEGEK